MVNGEYIYKDTYIHTHWKKDDERETFALECSFVMLVYALNLHAMRD